VSLSKIIAMMGVAPANFIGTNTYAPSGSSQSVSFSPAQAGDLAIIIGVQSVFSTPSGWTLAGTEAWGSLTNRICYKVLTSGDISTGSVSVSTIAGGLVMILIYRGATVATIVSSKVGSSTSLSVDGFTKNPSSRGVLTYVSEGGITDTIARPSGSASRNNFSSSVIRAAAADILPASFYGGGALVWTGLLSGTNNNVGQIIELT
jgi:hypothetical protein